MISRRVRAAGTALALASGSCAPDEHSGITRRFELPDGAIPGSAGSGGAGSAGSGGDAGTITEPPPAPEVEAMMPLSGPYGTQVRITGVGLGSAAREGVTLTLGGSNGRELAPTSEPEIVIWTETEIVFRFPFPLSGTVVIDTPEGAATAGEFEPTWEPGEGLAVPAGTRALASLATAAGTVGAILDTGPPRFVESDSAGFTEVEIESSGLRQETLRLYRDGAAPSAFALSAATSYEIMALDPADDFARTSTGIEAAAKYAIAGGREGASVWFAGDSGWERARPTGGAWSVDQGPVADPTPAAGTKDSAAAGSDGSLYVGWAEETGDALDDLGAPFFRRLQSGSASFLAKTRAGVDVDDYVSSLRFEDRGAGLVAHYCGSDADPLGASSTDLLCYVGLVPAGVRASLKESTGTRYAFDGLEPSVAYCSSNHGTRLVRGVASGGTTAGQLDAQAGETVVWPCAPVVALEIDDDGEALLMIEHDGKLYSPRPRAP